MIQGAHTKKESLPISVSSTGDNVILTGTNDKWIYVHELIGSLTGSGTIIVKAGSRDLAKFVLGASQGITEQDEPGEDNRPRFECKPGENFILNLTAGVTFNGAIHYSFSY